MSKNKRAITLTNFFENQEIRSTWDKGKHDYLFCVTDIICALTQSNNPVSYWTTLKNRLLSEGSQLVSECQRIKLTAKDGKARETDVLDTKGILRLIESIPSPKAEPFKQWLAQLGKDRIDEVFDPELAINRAIKYYHSKGYDDTWISKRIQSILSRNKLTETWKENGIKNSLEYAILTNEIYKEWSGMKASEYKDFKHLRKESLRDNMTDIELVLTELGEITTRDIVKNERPESLTKNREIAKRGGTVSRKARENYEEATGQSAISSENMLDYEYEPDHGLETGGQGQD